MELFVLQPAKMVLILIYKITHVLLAILIVLLVKINILHFNILKIKLKILGTSADVCTACNLNFKFNI